MARSLYQATLSLKDTEGDLAPLENVRVTVTIAGGGAATIYQDTSGASQGPRPASGATGGPNPFTTGPSGAVEFYADAPEAYDISLHDLNVPARLTDQTFRWDAISVEDNSFPGVKLVDASVTNAKLASGIDGTKLTAGSVPGSKLTSASVNGDRMVDASIASAKLTSVDGAKLIDGTVVGAKIASGAIGSSQIADGSITLTDLATALQQALIPSGTILAYGGSSAPGGFAMCDGTVVSRTGTYAALFAVIGTTYNIGGEAGTDFRLPDLRGRVPVGVDGSANRITGSDALGNSGGADKITLIAEESGIAAHAHPNSFSINGNTVTPASTPWFPVNDSAWVGPASVPIGSNQTGIVGTHRIAEPQGNVLTYSQGSHIHTLSGSVLNVTKQNAEQPHSNMQPYQIVNHIIKI